MELKSSIPQWFTNQSVFITGSTGFMGKILVEKLLRDCPSIRALFLLIRPKRGKTPQQRLESYLNEPIFHSLREKNAQVFQKIRLVTGDTTLKNLGLNEVDLVEVRAHTSVVFHVAACVRFDQTLQQAVDVNVKGTYNLLELSTSLNLQAFIHVSTSYCHCGESLVEERVYDSAHPPLRILEMTQWMNSNLLQYITKQLLGLQPNTYAYTKSLTEQLVASYSKQIPMVIARPSIVTPVWKGPISGWVDNLNGAVGLLVGAGKGIVRTMHCDPLLPADIIPVDVVINSLIILATEANNEITVANITADTTNPIVWYDVVEINRKHFQKFPFSVCLWYPGGAIQSNYFLHVLSMFLFHTIPAYFVDFLLPIFGHKAFLVRTQQRISNGLNMLQYYTTREWTFKNERIKQIVQRLSKEDRQLFYTDMSELNYDDYLLDCLLGARKYTIGEDISTVPQARRNLRKLYLLDRFVNYFLIGLLLWVSYAVLTVFV